MFEEVKKELLLGKYVIVGNKLVTQSGVVIEKNERGYQITKEITIEVLKKHFLSTLLDDIFRKNEEEESLKNFVYEQLKPYLLQNKETLESCARINFSMTPKVLEKDKKMKIMLIAPYLDYKNCERLGFTNVLAGEILTESRKIWPSNSFLKDFKGNDHPDFSWASSQIENVDYTKSTFLCLSRKKGISKISMQFSNAIVGYFGIKDSESLRWKKEFYDREIKNEYEEDEKEEILENGKKALVHFYIK